MEKILTIIIPSYNMERYLEKCLQSLIIDDPDLLKLLDIIIVNDGSKDSTSEIGHRFERVYPSVYRVIDKANGHYGSCVNRGLAEAKGRFVKVLDADDAFRTGSFCKFISFLVGLPNDVDLVISDYENVDSNGSIVNSTACEFPQEVSFDVDRFVSEKKYIPMHMFTYRTQMLRDMNYVQLEGVSYTDSEWVTLPLCDVRKVRYFSHVVYSRLLGREGQSIDPRVIARDYWMKARLAVDVAKKMDHCCVRATSHVREKLFSWLDDLIAGIYRQGIFGTGGLHVNVDIASFNEELKVASAAFYDRAGSAVFSNCVPFHYVAAWREKSKLFVLKVSLCRGAAWLGRKTQSVLRRLGVK